MLITQTLVLYVIQMTSVSFKLAIIRSATVIVRFSEGRYIYK